MKVTVTHLKAPWPAGTVPGHVVDFPGLDEIPAWAAGKCVPAADDAEAVSAWTRPEQPAELVVNPAAGGEEAEAEARAAQALADAEAQAEAERKALEAEAEAQAAAQPAASKTAGKAKAAAG